MKNYKNIDDLLEQSLSSNEVPSIGLNIELKIKMENQIEENKGISIWWLPMTISTCINAMAYILFKLYLNPGIMQNIFILLCGATFIFNIIMTIIGTKYFELRKGARVNI